MTTEHYLRPHWTALLLQYVNSYGMAILCCVSGPRYVHKVYPAFLALSHPFS